MVGDGLSDDELSFARQCSIDWMPEVAYILRNAGAVNAIGGREISWGTIGTVACRAYASSSEGVEGEANGVIAADGVWTLVVPHDTDVTVKDRVELSTATYSVISNDHGRTTNVDIRLKAIRRD